MRRTKLERRHRRRQLLLGLVAAGILGAALLGAALSTAIAEPLGSKAGASGFVPAYGTGTAGSVVVHILDIAAVGGQVQFSAWDWNGTSWTRKRPVAAYGDSTYTLESGQSTTLYFSASISIDAFYVSGAGTANMDWE